MKRCPKEYFYAVERALREYPARERELRMFDRFIEECCHATRLSAEPLSARLPSSAQERIVMVKERSGYYRWLARHVETLRHALGALDGQETRIVENLYWDEFSVSEVADDLQRDRRVVHRARSRIFKKLAPFLIPDLFFAPPDAD